MKNPEQIIREACWQPGDEISNAGIPVKDVIQFMKAYADQQKQEIVKALEKRIEFFKNYFLRDDITPEQRQTAFISRLEAERIWAEIKAL